LSNPQAKDQPLSAVLDCLFNTFAATLHIGGRSSVCNLRTRHVLVTGTHLLQRMNNRMPKIILNYIPNEWRQLGRPLKGLLDEVKRGEGHDE